ncbi:hypothetical protein O0I10_009717 [Lichtheimia ornata]|uniref:Uncharacterized protein n=1 Tax=Lichtheimia ornata TaxID=688661 RepID=A0AAD7XVT6_9FUNG|nr:uncharacterized protein O0I10_009717 [Lichtheimia ornata]KAJ8654666.1 hypothetical protein O0I10_009717 [Lichtheimia ornata]
MLLANPPAQLVHFTTEIHPRCISPSSPSSSFFSQRSSRRSFNDNDSKRIYKVLQSIDEESEQDVCKPLSAMKSQSILDGHGIRIQRRSSAAAVVAPYGTSNKESSMPSDNTISRSSHFPTNGPCAPPPRRRSSAPTQLVTILEEDES